MKLLKLKWLLIGAPFITLVSSSCTTIVKKNKQNWGDEKFVKEIIKNNTRRLSYLEDAQNAQFVAPYSSKNNSETIYQLTVYSFADGNGDGIGDFIGLKNNLDYFINLGINTLYLSPIHPASSYHGYDVIDYLGVAPELGGEQAFIDFLKEAHKNGIKVVLDMVFNHTSYEHPWFQAALQGNKEYQNYYYFLDDNISNVDGLGEDNQGVRNLFLNIDKSIPATNKKYVAEFWSGMPDLNLNNPKVINELKAIQRYWSKIGVDGFRYDAFYHFFDSKNPYKDKTNRIEKTNTIFASLRETTADVLNDGNQRSSQTPFMFGEWWQSPSDSLIYTNKVHGGLDSVIDGVHWKHTLDVGINYNQEKAILELVSQNNSRWMPFLDNHDVERWINSVRSKINFTGKNIFTNEPLNESEKSMLQYGLTSLLSRGGSPILYDGIELNMHGGPQRKGDSLIREAFPWKDQSKVVDFYEKRSGEEYSRVYLNLSVNEQKIEDAIKDSQSTYSLVSKLNKIRNDYPYVVSQQPNSVVDPYQIINKDTISGVIVDSNVVVRTNQKGEFLLYLFNWGNNDLSFRLKDGYKITEVLYSKNTQVSENNKVTGKGVGTILVAKVNNLTSQ
ncbi:alpha-amylase family glycosyl hydrolase [Mycoplasmopsis columboralis]|uniref:Alpha-amylase n=1 Tax=Mycoplasmopsis columboralis TaxID=171282 RepID=A0A449B6L7_9BACT|nr:alpha-amylase family glycosyl hydrolase [Mycoplasmopsis columboralis]VEU76257.1 Alpha-amylase precursor [Mycoplasmopsis columboralis]